jgi:c(7)-type cytochrome triheme protein
MQQGSAKSAILSTVLGIAVIAGIVVWIKSCDPDARPEPPTGKDTSQPSEKEPAKTPPTTPTKGKAATGAKEPPQLAGLQTIEFPPGEEHLGVLFSHASHARFGFKECENCHNDEVFSKEQKLGANRITMDDIYAGKWCGHCHNGNLLTADDRPVFAPRDQGVDQCVLCHNVKPWTKADPVKAWNPPPGVQPATGRIGAEKEEKK